MNSSASGTAVERSDVARFLTSKLSGKPRGGVGILAGHFALFSGGGLIKDFLSDRRVPSVAREMVEFTKFTWSVVCDVFSSCSQPGDRLVVLADDVTFVRPQILDRRMSERLAHSLVEQYFSSGNNLPAFHLEQLTSSGLSIADVASPAAGGHVFSERALRTQFIMRARNAAIESDDYSLIRDPNGDVRISGRDMPDYKLVVSGNTNCVGAYLELADQLRSQGIEKLILFVPSRCFGQVCTGAAIAEGLGWSGGNVIHVGIPDGTTSARAMVSRQYTGH